MSLADVDYGWGYAIFDGRWVDDPIPEMEGEDRWRKFQYGVFVTVYVLVIALIVLLSFL